MNYFSLKMYARYLRIKFKYFKSLYSLHLSYREWFMLKQKNNEHRICFLVFQQFQIMLLLSIVENFVE